MSTTPWTLAQPIAPMSTTDTHNLSAMRRASIVGTTAIQLLPSPRPATVQNFQQSLLNFKFQVPKLSLKFTNMFQNCNDVMEVVKVFDGQDPKSRPKLIVREMQREGYLKKCGNCPNCPNHPELKLVANKHYKGGYLLIPRSHRFSIAIGL
jgi:hypothetical protein